MSTCDDIRANAAELALGIADGEERARALEHIAECPDCREHLRELADVADEMLLFAPPAEPPVGFEARVSEALAGAPGGETSHVVPPRGGRWTFARWRMPALAAAAAAIVAAAGVWIALADDRDLAGEYRDVLAVANGSYFEANHLDAPGGESVGYIYGYEGRTSWLLAVLYDVPDGTYRLIGAKPGGERSLVTKIDVVNGHGTAGGALPSSYENFTEVCLIGPHGRQVADADLNLSD